jgi:hypothetical protein
MQRLILEDRKAYLDDLLKRITESLQLNESRRILVTQRYSAVSRFIEQSPGLFNDAHIYAQGSYRIGTTVRPREGEEYDLDFVVQLNKEWKTIPFSYVYDEFKKLLRSDGNWEKLVIEKPRCIRLNYADEFHMDIIPTCTENPYSDRNRIMIPDKTVHNWAISNPEGYALWFESKYIAQRNIYLTDFYPGMEIRAAQDLPKDNPNYLKQPIQHAVQLIKRYRDVYFEGREKWAPSSIVLTTLVGELYNSENTIVETINNVIYRFETSVDSEKRYYRQFHIKNPVLPEEIFTREWETNPQLFKEFLAFINSLRDLWYQLHSLQGHQLFEVIKKSFGTGAFETAYKNQGEFIELMRNEGKTGISRNSGMAGALTGINIQKDRPNTFHGGCN